MMALVTSRAASYWRLSRTPRYTLVFALPLLVLYEALAAILGDVHGAVRNGADVWLKAPFIAVFGARGPAVFGAAVVVGSAALVWRDVRRTRDGVRANVLLRMLGESAVLALVCAVLVGLATSELMSALPHLVPQRIAWPVPAALGRGQLGAPRTLMLALGAGLYEELLFRVLLVSGLRLVARRFVGLGEAGAALAAVVGGALLFSAAHYVGPYGDTLTLASFTFRAIAGLFFSGVYVLRGFGIAAWTHALYDVGVLFGAG